MICIFNRRAAPSEYERMKNLFSQVLKRIPQDVLSRMPVINITVEHRVGHIEAVRDIVAGHEPPSVDAYFQTKKEPRRFTRQPDFIIPHNISIYTNILSRMSDSAVMSVMAHEIAHGWLDEIGLPHLDSNERDADVFARKWGFGEGLVAFEREFKALGFKYMEF